MRSGTRPTRRWQQCEINGPPDPPPAPVSKPPPREDAGVLFFDGVRALLDDAYRAKLIKRRPLEPERGADHGVNVPPTTREARDLVFLDDARERPTTDVDPGGASASQQQ